MKKLGFFFIFVFAGILLIGCNNEKNAENPNNQTEEKQSLNNTEKVSEKSKALKLKENEKAGKYLADVDGMTLYYFTKDKPDTTNCSGECLENWPAFYSENIQVPEGFNKEDFDTITREDTGQKQTTFKGYPLYYFIKDKMSGDVKGQGVKNVWFIVNSETTFAQ